MTKSSAKIFAEPNRNFGRFLFHTHTFSLSLTFSLLFTLRLHLLAGISLSPSLSPDSISIVAGVFALVEQDLLKKLNNIMSDIVYKQHVYPVALNIISQPFDVSHRLRPPNPSPSLSLSLLM